MSVILKNISQNELNDTLSKNFYQCFLLKKTMAYVHTQATI